MSKKSILRVLLLHDADFYPEIIRPLTKIFPEIVHIRVNILLMDYSISVYRNGKLTEFRKISPPKPINVRGLNLISKLLIYYLIWPFYSLTLSLTASRMVKHPFDLVIADNSEYKAFAALFLRKLRKARKVVYWCPEWHPQSREGLKGIELLRLISFMMDTLVDRFAVEHCDVTWDIAERISKERKARWHGVHLPKTRIVPVPMSNRPRTVHEKSNEFTYLGRGLGKGVGVELAVEALTILRQRGLDFHANIITGAMQFGEEHSNLIQYAKSKGVQEYLSVYKYLEDEEVTRILCRSFCGLAIFYGPNHLSNLTIPGKLLHYLRHGLPLIISKDSTMAELIKKSGAGIAIDYDPLELANALIELQTDWNNKGIFSENASRLLANEFGSAKLDEALLDSLKNGNLG